MQEIARDIDLRILFKTSMVRKFLCKFYFILHSKNILVYERKHGAWTSPTIFEERTKK